jgi:hypothetical protein
MPARIWLARLVCGALVVTALLVWGGLVRSLIVVKPVVPHSARPTAIVWHDRVFSSRKQIAVWLRSHGRDYRGWARQHPGAIAVLEHRPVKKRPAAPPVTTVPNARAIGRVSHHGDAAWVGYVLWTIVAMLAAAALVASGALRTVPASAVAGMTRSGPLQPLRRLTGTIGLAVIVAVSILLLVIGIRVVVE